MSDFQQFWKWLIRTVLKAGLIAAPLLLVTFLAVSASKGTFSFNPLGPLVGSAVLLFAEEIAAWFVQDFYGLQTRASARGFLLRPVFGQGSANPYLLVKEGAVDTKGNEVAQKIGGPVLLVIYNDSAVVLEQAGQLTRVVRGPASLELASFEKVWDSLDLRPQRWSFPVNAMTRDGIPITYEADIQFQIGETDDDVFKAAVSMRLVYRVNRLKAGGHHDRIGRHVNNRRPGIEMNRLFRAFLFADPAGAVFQKPAPGGIDGVKRMVVGR